MLAGSTGNASLCTNQFPVTTSLHQSSFPVLNILEYMISDVSILLQHVLQLDHAVSPRPNILIELFHALVTVSIL
jgi:hypothetical protein